MQRSATIWFFFRTAVRHQDVFNIVEGVIVKLFEFIEVKIRFQIKFVIHNPHIETTTSEEKVQQAGTLMRQRRRRPVTSPAWIA